MKFFSKFKVGFGFIFVLLLVSVVPASMASGNGGFWYVEPGGEVTNSGNGTVDLNGEPEFYTFLPCVLKNYAPCNGYFDDFSDPDSGWVKGYFNNIWFRYLAGDYNILIEPAFSYAFVYPGAKGMDFSVSVKLRNQENVLGSYGILFGLADDWSSFYSLEIYPDGWFGVYRYDPTQVVILSEAYSPAINQGSSANEIIVERVGASIKAYANDQLLANIVDGMYTGYRYIGLIAFSYEEEYLDVRFDDFTVCQAGSPVILPDALQAPAIQPLLNFGTNDGELLTQKRPDLQK